MAKPETPAEHAFIKMLGDYYDLLLYHEHITVTDEEGLQRVLACYTSDEVFAVMQSLVKILRTVTSLLEASTRGEIRASWTHELPDVAKTIVKVGNIINDVLKLRYN